LRLSCRGQRKSRGERQHGERFTHVILPMSFIFFAD
jgi:hypothetical protein